MEFLQRSAHSTSKKADKITSKSREKDKRRVERAHVEISTFFNTPKVPLQERSRNIQHERPSIFVNNTFSAGMREEEPGQSPSQSQSLGFSGDAYEQPDPSSHEFSMPRSEPFKNRADDGTNSRYSGNGTNYVTWSETQASPIGMSIVDQKRRTHAQTSPIPESVRKSIQNTGIFDGTGISMSPKDSISRPKISTGPSHLAKDSHIARGAASVSDVTSSRTSEIRSSEVVKRKTENLPPPPQGRSPNARRAVLHRNIESRSSTVLPPDQLSTKDIQHYHPDSNSGRVMVKHFDQDLGWHQRQTCKASQPQAAGHPSRSAEAEESRSTPIDRAQLAQQARIKRPSTTLLVLRTTGNEPYNEQKARVADGKVEEKIQKLGARKQIRLGEVVTTRHTDISSVEISQKDQEQLSIGASIASAAQQRLDQHLDVPHRKTEVTEEINQYRQLPQPDETADTEVRDDVNLGRIRILDSNQVIDDSSRQESWICRVQSLGFPNPRTRFSPALEVAPLYFHQMEQNSVLDELPEHQSHYEHHRNYATLEEGTQSPGVGQISYLDNLDYEEFDAAVEEFGLQNYSLEMGQNEIQHVNDRAHDEWQPAGSYGGNGIDGDGFWQEPEQRMPLQYAAYDTQAGFEEPIAHPPNNIGDYYQDPQIQERSISTQEFWGLNRPY